MGRDDTSPLKRLHGRLQSGLQNDPMGMFNCPWFCTPRLMTLMAMMEYQAESQYLFEKTFDLKFFVPFSQVTQNETRTGKVLPTLNDSVLDQIKNLNLLDTWSLSHFQTSVSQSRVVQW